MRNVPSHNSIPCLACLDAKVGRAMWANARDDLGDFIWERAIKGADAVKLLGYRMIFPCDNEFMKKYPHGLFVSSDDNAQMIPGKELIDLRLIVDNSCLCLQS